MEARIKTGSGQEIWIKKEQSDPLALRISIGGSEKDGYYLVFRGDDLIEIENMLEDTLSGFRKMRVQLNKRKKNEKGS